MTTITIPEIQTTHPTLSAPYLGDLMTQFDHATQSSNPLSELEQAIIDGEYDIEVTEILDVIVEFTLQTSDTIGTYTRVSPEFQTIRNAIVDCTGVLRSDLDIPFYRREITRENIEQYCRAVLFSHDIAHRGYENRMVLIERAIRIVTNISREDMAGIPISSWG